MKVTYIKGVHCGDSECYACGTQRYNCSRLDRLDDGRCPKCDQYPYSETDRMCPVCGKEIK